MKKVILIIFLLAIGIYAYREINGVDVKFINNSKSTISDLKFYTTEKLKMVELSKLEPGEAHNNFLSMLKNKTDGSYILEFTNGNGKRKIKNGYYTNGSPLDRSARIEFTQDTVLFNLKQRGIY